MSYVCVSSLDELEELYTKHIITYYQYLNLKKEIEEKASNRDKN